MKITKEHVGKQVSWFNSEQKTDMVCRVYVQHVNGDGTFLASDGREYNCDDNDGYWHVYLPETVPFRREFATKDSGEVFTTKDSGERKEFSTGMVRDTTVDKARYDLVWKPGLKRIAELMGRGQKKYGPRNWEKADTQTELDRFRESANRHFEQWMAGDRDEDHMAAVVFNLFGAEYVRQKMAARGETIEWH